jgi:regulator of cell morphogenesis and NO signaling
MTTARATKEHTLAEIVDLDAGSARVLERFGLDYCCGGGRTLAEACARTEGVDADEVLDALTATAPQGAPAWAAMGPAELVDHIESTHHAYLHAELPRLVALAEKVEGVHGGRHPELARVAELTEALRLDLEPHLAKEEAVLFPMIRQLAAGDAASGLHCGGIANPIRVMLAEHDRTGELLSELDQATGGHRPPGDACTSYRMLYEGLAQVAADTHLHVHKENDVLFPAVLALADAATAVPQP